MSEYEVQIDVTMSGSLYIEADSEKEAIEKVKAKSFVASDLRNFHQSFKEITDVYQTDIPTFGDVWKGGKK
jgi:hypothetical protein